MNEIVRETFEEAIQGYEEVRRWREGALDFRTSRRL
jgi:hypothetical protein